jgi:hypothetical protein
LIGESFVGSFSGIIRDIILFLRTIVSTGSAEILRKI